MPSFKNGINCTFLEEVDENPCRSYNRDMLIPKEQGGSRGNSKGYYWKKRLRRTRPSAAQVNNSYFPQTDVQLSDPIFS